MKRLNWKVMLVITLLLLSTGFYFLHYLIFRDLHHIFVYLIGDIGFVFIEVLLVTLLIHRVLERREKMARLEKLNMIIGAFFSEVGIELLNILSKWDPQIEKIQQELFLGEEAEKQKFAIICKYLRAHSYKIESNDPNLDNLKTFLVSKRDFLLRLLVNPNLLEHESFTLVLWAVFHLTEELEAREDLKSLSGEDTKHLIIDINRVYGQLSLQWLSYMEHLQDSYPFLFSLSLRKNPFNKNATPVVQ
jgi:hypothetical protein